MKETDECQKATAPGAFPHLADYEAAVELNYKARLTAWWTLHAAIERGLHPGDSSQDRDAWSFNLATMLRI